MHHLKHKFPTLFGNISKSVPQNNDFKCKILQNPGQFGKILNTFNVNKYLWDAAVLMGCVGGFSKRWIWGSSQVNLQPPVALQVPGSMLKPMAPPSGTVGAVGGGVFPPQLSPQHIAMLSIYPPQIQLQLVRNRTAFLWNNRPLTAAAVNQLITWSVTAKSIIYICTVGW